MTHDRSILDAIKARLVDPRDVAERLAIEHRRGEGYVCPSHGGASLSLTRGRDRTLRIKCFGGCDLAGDVFDLIAAVDGVDRDDRFPDVIRRGADLAGISLDPAVPLPPPPPRRPPPKPKTYPAIGEVEALWSAAVPVMDDEVAAAWCASRGLDGDAIDLFGLARALPLGAKLPRWAAYRGNGDHARPWTETGHRILVPVYDHAGIMCSVRGNRIEGEENTPKRLPPSGHQAAGLVLADPLALLVLRGEDQASWPNPLRIIIAEGEPDFLTWATRYTDADEDAPGIFGVLAGGWTAEHARRIPDGADVLIDTHHDQAGDRYAADVIASLEGRCSVRRSRGGA